MISYYQRTLTSRALKQSEEYLAGAWVYVEDPTEKEIAHLSNSLNLEESLILDGVDPYEVPRIEIEEGTTYLFTRIPYQNGKNIFTYPVLLGISEDFVFTVSRHRIPFLEKLVDGKVEVRTTQRVRMLLQLLAEIDLEYAKFITLINKDVRKLSDSISTSIRNEDIIKFVDFETILADLLAGLVPTQAMMQKVLSGKFLKLYEEDRDFVEDIALENGQLIELCQTNLRSITNIRNAYSTIMTNDLNRVIKLLTSLTIVLTVPSILVNFYGMNVPLPGQESPYAYLGIIAGTVSVTLFLSWAFKRENWL